MTNAFILATSVKSGIELIKLVNSMFGGYWKLLYKLFKRAKKYFKISGSHLYKFLTKELKYFVFSIISLYCPILFLKLFKNIGTIDFDSIGDI